MENAPSNNSNEPCLSNRRRFLGNVGAGLALMAAASSTASATGNFAGGQTPIATLYDALQAIRAELEDAEEAVLTAEQKFKKNQPERPVVMLDVLGPMPPENLKKMHFKNGSIAMRHTIASLQWLIDYPANNPSKWGSRLATEQAGRARNALPDMVRFEDEDRRCREDCGLEHAENLEASLIEKMAELLSALLESPATTVADFNLKFATWIDCLSPAAGGGWEFSESLRSDLVTLAQMEKNQSKVG